MTKPTIEPTSHPETCRFVEYFHKEATRGLKDLKFFAKDTSETKLDQFFLEVNQALASEGVTDPSVI